MPLLSFAASPAQEPSADADTQGSYRAEHRGLLQLNAGTSLAYLIQVDN
jgi:hypothetical protein